MFSEKFPHTAMRADKSDQDPDKESKFWMLVQSKCPAILPEWLFFDTYEDWVIMRDPINQMNYAQMIADFCNQVK
jgi:N-acetylmuramoyl-L-alanine amidase